MARQKQTHRGARSRYTSAGYSQDHELYIANTTPGSAQDNLRDYNQRGYEPLSEDFKSDRPWRNRENDLPLEQPDPSEQESLPISRKRYKKHKGFGDWILMQARRERGSAILCVVLFTVLLVIIAAASQNMIEGNRVQSEIEQYRMMTDSLTIENENIAMQLELAKDGGRIRNLAQNSLGMLRPERALHQSIHIQATTQELAKEAPQVEEQQMSFLDIMLGLLDVFHIGE